MKPLHKVELGEIIAERTLKRDLSDKLGDVIVRLGAPRKTSDGGEYGCSFEVSGIGEDVVRCIYGYDAFQALELTLRIIGTFLFVYKRDVAPDLHWLEPGDDLGFPVGV